MFILTDDRRLIEDSFPVKEVGVQSAMEKSIRHGHPSTLHIWWARRPLAASRTTCYAALVQPPKESNVGLKRDFIIEFSTWKNTTNERMVSQARKEILEANKERPPKVLDPFAGGGSIPLELLRLGCETYSSDLNPVAVLIQKCMLEYPQKYGGRTEPQEGGEMRTSQSNPLLEDVRKWALWVLEKCRAEISEFYPDDSETKNPVGYIWARTIKCQNPSCGISIPLMRQFWLSRRTDRNVALFPIVKKKEVHFRVVGDGYQKMPEDFDPKKGTVKGAIATCPACGGTIDAKTTRRLFRDYHAGELMVAVVVNDTRSKGKSYRTATESDLSAFDDAQRALMEKNKRLAREWGINPIPDEALPPKETLGFRVQRYGILKWGDLFNDRQKLALLTFTQYIRYAHEGMLKDGYDVEYAKAIASYLALIVDRLADKNATLVFYNAHRETIEHVFSRQTLSMVWDYIEVNPFASSGWSNMTDWVERNIEQLSLSSSTPASVSQSNAASLEFSNEMFDAVFTDPPYYDNVPYSYLSDFFYVWLKRTIGHLYPDLFSTPLTPKNNEIVAYSHGPGGFEEGKRYFEEKLSESFKEIHRVLRPGGIAVIVYAHKSTAGWETLINSLLNSGLVVTAAWSINTEKTGRLRSHESAALASSIYVVARKTKQQDTGLYRDFKEELKSYLNKKLEYLWSEGIGGADFFIAAIGSAIEVFGKFKKVIDYDGSLVRANRLLEDVRVIATDYAIQKILRNGFSGDVTPLTRFYVLFRWYYQTAKVDFDEARKLAQSCGIDLVEQWTGSGFVRKEKEFIRVLGPHERKLEHSKEHAEMVDVLHVVLLLWERGKRDEILEVLTKSGFARNEAFWRVAQAISETLLADNKEKKLLDGFLTGRNGYIDREQHEQVTVEGTPTRSDRKKQRRRQSPQKDTQDEYEQVELE